MLEGETTDPNQKGDTEGSALVKKLQLIGKDTFNITEGLGKITGLLTKLPLGPLKNLFSGILGVTTGVADQFLKIDAIASKMTQTFGIGKANIQQTKETLYDAGAELLTFSKSFDSINEAMEGANKIAASYSATLNRSILLSKESIVELQAVTEATGVGTDKLIPAFVNAGIRISSVGDEMKDVMNYAISMGVNVNAVASRVADNLKQFDKYNFQNGVQGLTKMATQAAMLGTDMGKVFEIADKLMDPDSAIEMSAALQRLGVTQSDLLDPLRLMDLAQNDPAELQNQIAQMAKQFGKLNEQTGQFEIINKRGFKEVAAAMGYPVDELSKMAKRGMEADTILSQLSMPTFDMTEDDKSLITNLAQFDKATGEYKIKVGQEEKAVGLLTDKDFEELRKAVEPKEVKDVAQEQLSANQVLNRSLETLNQTQIEGIVTNKTLNTTMQSFNTKAQAFTKKQVGDDVSKNKEKIGIRDAKKIEEILPKGKEKITDIATNLNDTIAKDFIFRPGQDPLRFSEGDLVMGIDEKSLSNPKKPSEFSEESLNNYKIPSEGSEKSLNTYKIPSDSNDNSLDRFNEVKSQSQTITNIQQASGEITLNVVIKAEVPAGMDKEMFNTLITDTNVIQNIKNNIEKVSSNFNLTPKKSY